MTDKVLCSIEEYIRSYGNGSLVPISLKDSSPPALSVHSRVVDPYLLHFGSLSLVLTLEKGNALSARLLTRCLTPFRPAIHLCSDVRSLKVSKEFKSFLDLLTSENLSSCSGLPPPERGGKEDLLVERLGEYLVYRSHNCAFVVEGKGGICSQCAQLRPRSKPKEIKGEETDDVVHDDAQSGSSQESQPPPGKLRKRKPKAPSYKCPSCEKAFSEIPDFKDHCATHSDVLMCTEVDTCIKTFKSQIYLDIHIRRHQGIKKSYECETCHKHFLSNADLRIHSYTHTGEKPISCNVCGKKFVKKGHLQVHARVHTGEKPHLCSDCGVSFAALSTLIDHRKRKHMFHRPHGCPQCHKEFFSRQELSNHTIIHSGEKPFACEICDKTFSRSHHLKRHTATLHKNAVPEHTSVAEEKEDDVQDPLLNNYLGSKDQKPFQILPDSATSSLLELSEIVADDTGDDYENAKYVIIEGDDGSAKLIQYSNQ